MTNNRAFEIGNLFFLGIAFAGFLSACSPMSKQTYSGENNLPQPANREFRAAWVASVANINWPSKPGLTVQEQKEEAIGLLDLLQTNNFNAVLLQVRPQCDALYPSELEPWSYFLTGETGKAPDPYYDPLKFWIREAHVRGIELHAWLNPYRAHHTTSGALSEKSLAANYPEMAVALENGMYWLDPADQRTQDHSFAVIMDLIKRYEVDGIHFDDYFYPYPSYNNNKDFPDHASWQKYLDGGGKLTRDDWRRAAVNTFIERVYKGIKKKKKEVLFGISPFGIWRPGFPNEIQGMDAYSTLYADARLWLQEGWVDYLTPQLYWPINQEPQSFPRLLGWWQDQNSKNRNLWPGSSIGRYEGEAGIDEVNNHIMISRGMLRPNPGLVHWSIAALQNNPDLMDALRNGVYKNKALIPASPWLSEKKPKMPAVSIRSINGSYGIRWSHNKPETLKNWVVYVEQNGKWSSKIHTTLHQSILLDTDGKKPSKIAVSVVDKFGNESPLYIQELL